MDPNLVHLCSTEAMLNNAPFPTFTGPQVAARRATVEDQLLETHGMLAEVEHEIYAATKALDAARDRRTHLWARQETLQATRNDLRELDIVAEAYLRDAGA